MRFRCMFYIFRSSRCCKTRSGVAYYAMSIYVCCKYMFQMFQLFQTYVVNVLSRCYICCIGYTHVANVYFNCFIWFQYVATGAAPHAFWLVGTHALHAPIQRSLSLLCRPAPIVKRARNGRPVPKWLSTPLSKCMCACRAPEQANAKQTQNQALHHQAWSSMMEHAVGVNTGTHAVLPPSLSRLQLSRPYAHALLCGHSSSTLGRSKPGGAGREVHG
jgi:hypothetical protein